jgi:hypothetical protein
MREQLTKWGLVAEQAAGCEYAGDLGHGLRWVADVVTGPEVDNDVKGRVRKWERTDIGADELNVETSR